MSLEVLTADNKQAWDNFVLHNEQANLACLAGWREAITKAYSHPPYYLLCKDRGEVKGILSSFIFRSRLFGKKIVSMPFLSYGGLAFREELAEQALLDKVQQKAKQLGGYSVELRTSFPLSGLEPDLSNFTFCLDLTGGEQAVFKKINKKLRNQIRKSSKSGFVLKNSWENLKHFYYLYQKTMRRLGTPVHSFKFFREISRAFPKNAEILLSFLKEKPAAGLFLFKFKETVFNLWGASEQEFWLLNPNEFIYWQAVKMAEEQGFRVFDFGRSQKENGAFHFKEQWCRPKQLYYYFLPNLKDSGKGFQSAGLRKAAKIWQKMPLALTNLLGPKLRKFIP